MEKAETRQDEKKIQTEIEETKLVEEENTKEEEKGTKKTEASPKTLEMEEALVLAALNTLVKPKKKATINVFQG